MRPRWRVLISVLVLTTVASVAARIFGQTPKNLNVSRIVLKNGLTVLALEDHSVPSVAYRTIFKVGSRNERPGITGLSHLFEHMMFNGSPRVQTKGFCTPGAAGGGGFATVP